MLILLFLLTFCFCGLSTAGEQKSALREEKISLDEFEFAMVNHPTVPTDGYVIKLSRQGKEIFSGECAFRIHKPQIVKGLPNPDCRSLLAYCYSGGAHCCQSLIIVTKCGSQASANIIDLAHSDEARFVELGTEHSKAIRVTDWQFAYYSAEEGDLSLSFADSPGMQRLLVFEGGKWRPDNAGEFVQFYQGLFKQAQVSARSFLKDTDTFRAAGAAIKAGYYLSMLGKPAPEVNGELENILPPTWKPGAEKIGEDIMKAVSGFNPVEVIE